MSTILAHLRVKPGCEARFEEIARDLYRGTHGHEAGVLHYQYWRGADPRTYYTLLSFDDHRTFIAHQTSDHHEAASPQLGEVLEAIRLEWVDPIAGASDLPRTEHQPALDGADAKTVQYTDRFAAQVASWWAPLR
jgi:quinol monooxygenase YgiN